MTGIVCVENLTKDYGGNGLVTRALAGVTFSVQPAEFTAMVGPSGSGKSTLLNIVGGLDRPTAGRVFIEGRDLATLSDREVARLRRERIGFVFQSYNLIPVLTALENAEYVLMLMGVPTAARRERVAAVLKEVGLAGMERRFPRELSGGQQQRVAIARAIAAEPALVLADEPTANVDSLTAHGLLDLMARLNQERGITFLFSTHDPRVMKRARRVLVLKDGAINYDGPVQGSESEIGAV
jgi:putative ABC transport system ATP-binding protein